VSIQNAIEKLPVKVLNTKVYWGPETELDHYLVIAPIQIPPRWVQKKYQVTYNK
jgi:hypothetical protein